MLIEITPCKSTSVCRYWSLALLFCLLLSRDVDCPYLSLWPDIEMLGLVSPR